MDLEPGLQVWQCPSWFLAKLELNTEKNVKLVVEAKIAARESVRQHTGLEQRHTGLATRIAFSN